MKNWMKPTFHVLTNADLTAYLKASADSFGCIFYFIR